MARDEKILPTRDRAFAWRLGPGLRESAVDASAFNGALDRIVDDIATARSQPAQLLALLTRAAPLLRIAGRLDEARKTAAAAIAIAELVEDSDAVFANQLALAQVLQRERRFEISTPLFDQLIVQARSSPALADRLHDVLFGAGVNLFEQQRYAQAAKCFRESQQLRRESGREDLLEISAEALRQTRDAENGVRDNFPKG
jgi:tetratricopeptide (TPR) repeat protein